MSRPVRSFILAAVAVTALLLMPPRPEQHIEQCHPARPTNPPVPLALTKDEDWRLAVDRSFWISVASGLTYTLGAAWIVFSVVATIAFAAVRGAEGEGILASALGFGILLIIQTFVLMLVGQSFARAFRLLDSGARWEQFSTSLLWVVALYSLPRYIPETLTPDGLTMVSIGVVVLSWIANILAIAFRRRYNWCGRLANWLGCAVGLAALLLTGVNLGVVTRFFLTGST